jgi:hypothetical protein
MSFTCTEGNLVYTSNRDVNYLAISCFDETTELIIKAWLLERNISFEGNRPCWIVIPYGMAAVNMTGFSLARELAKATGVITQVLIIHDPRTPIKYSPKHVQIAENNPYQCYERATTQVAPHHYEWKIPSKYRNLPNLETQSYKGEKIPPLLLLQLLVAKKISTAIADYSKPRLQLLILQQLQLP